MKKNMKTNSRSGACGNDVSRTACQTQNDRRRKNASKSNCRKDKKMQMNDIAAKNSAVKGIGIQQPNPDRHQLAGCPAHSIRITAENAQALVEGGENNV